MSHKLRWGILGTGNIARQFAAGVAVSQRGVVTAVASRSLESAQAFVHKFDAGKAYGDYVAILNDENVDAIYVALPNTLHHDWTLAAVRANKHVLCEKPMAASAAEAEQMFHVADAHGKLLMEAFMYRSHPMTQAVQTAIAAGEIGKLQLIRTSFCFRTAKTAGNIRFDASLAGGALMDVGCYCLNFSRLFAGAEPDRFEVVGNLHSSGVDELTAGVMHFPHKIVATFNCGMTTHSDNTAYLCGTEGYIEIPIPWKPPRENAAFTIGHSAPPKMDGGSGGPKPRETRLVSAPSDLYGTEADDFAAAIFDEEPLRVSREDTMGNMKLLDAMRERIGIAVPKMVAQPI